MLRSILDVVTGNHALDHVVAGYDSCKGCAYRDFVSMSSACSQMFKGCDACTRDGGVYEF
jgi:hypothetical protein